MAGRNNDPWVDFINDNKEFIGAGLVVLFAVAFVINAVGGVI